METLGSQGLYLYVRSSMIWIPCTPIIGGEKTLPPNLYMIGGASLSTLVLVVLLPILCYVLTTVTTAPNAKPVDLAKVVKA